MVLHVKLIERDTMISILKNLMLIFFIIILQSCLMSYGKYTDSNYTPITSGQYENRTGRIDIYFEGTTVERDYIEIGFVEVIGEEYDSNDILIAHLKYRAFQAGADAIINVKKNFKDRAKGYLFDTENTDEYAAPVFTGTAIKYTDTLATDSLQTIAADTSFKVKATGDLKKESNQIGTEIIMSFVVLVVVIVAVVIKYN